MPTLLSDQEIAAAVDKLPPVSSVIRRLLAVLNDPHSDVGDISKLIRVDTALTAQVLRLANSAQFGLPGGVSTIEEAIQQTGVNEITRVVSAINSKMLTTSPLEHYRISSSLLWQHTLAVAVAAEAVAERFLADTSAAYLAGLLHTIGLVTFEIVAATRKMPGLPPGTSIVEWEKKTFGCDNAALGARILSGWAFPPTVVNAVATRYTPPRPETVAELGGVLYLASAMAERVPAGLPPESGLFKVGEDVLGPLRLSREDVQEITHAVGQKLSRLTALI